MHLPWAPHSVFVFANSFSFPPEHVLFMYVKEQHTIHKKTWPSACSLKAGNSKVMLQIICFRVNGFIC